MSETPSNRRLIQGGQRVMLGVSAQKSDKMRVTLCRVDDAKMVVQGQRSERGDS
jgi:hypothetical protein